MRYIPCWKQIGISKDRYQELLHFCRQYPEWKTEANSLLGIRGMKQDGQPHGTAKSDPVAMAAEKRDRLLSKIGLVDQCASEVGNGEWYEAIIQNVCIGKPYTQINAALIPTSKGNPFFKYRREFFALLDKTMDR
jgi:hypothetical protein